MEGEALLLIMFLSHWLRPVSMNWGLLLTLCGCTVQNCIRLLRQINPNYNICFISSTSEVVFVSTQKLMNGFSQYLVKWCNMEGTWIKGQIQFFVFFLNVLNVEDVYLKFPQNYAWILTDIFRGLLSIQFSANPHNKPAFQWTPTHGAMHAHVWSCFLPASSNRDASCWRSDCPGSPALTLTDLLPRVYLF